MSELTNEQKLASWNEQWSKVTHTEPALLKWNGDDVDTPALFCGQYVDGVRTGYWMWILAGRQVISTFHYEADAPEKTKERLRLLAKEKIYEYVRARLAEGPIGTAIVGEGAPLPQ